MTVRNSIEVKGDDRFNDFISIEYKPYNNAVEVYSDDNMSPISSTTMFDKDGIDKLIAALTEIRGNFID